MAATSQSSWPFSWIRRWHHTFVHERRTRVLAETLAAQIQQGAAVLDIDCGDGTIASHIAHLRPDVSVQGVEFQVRAGCKIACHAFDGSKLPFPDASFDVCLFVDVLHHLTNPLALLKDACRVSRNFILLKDHFSENIFDYSILRLVDWVGNRPHGVPLPYAYRSRSQWQECYKQAGLIPISIDCPIPLYPWPFSMVFGRSLHFISLLKRNF